MKIIFKTENELILKELNDEQFTNDVQDELRRVFDNQQIIKYELIFDEGVLLKDVHNLNDLTPKNILSLTLTIRN